MFFRRWLNKITISKTDESETVKDSTDLAKSLADFINTLSIDSKLTINDWYDSINIPHEQRTDFVTAALFKQINERDLLEGGCCEEC